MLYNHIKTAHMIKEACLLLKKMDKSEINTKVFKDDDNMVRTNFTELISQKKLTVYDGNSDNVAYNFTVFDNRDIVITYSFASRIGTTDWDYTDVTMDQWTKFLNMLTLLSAPILAALPDRFRLLLDANESVFIPLTNVQTFVYEVRKDDFAKNRVIVEKINLDVHNVHDDLEYMRSHYFFTPFDPRLEQCANRYVSELSNSILSMFPYFNG